MKKVDINVDIGEGFSFDEDLLTIATSANICCGEHAGSWELSMRTVELALLAGRRIGAHPGYPDRENLGRLGEAIYGDRLHNMVGDIAGDFRERLLRSIVTGRSLSTQVDRFARAVHDLAYIKPHGALYTETAIPVPKDRAAISSHRALVEFDGDVDAKWLAGTTASGWLPCVMRADFGFMGLSSTAHEVVSNRHGIKFIAEGFADRRYREDGTLVPRTEPNAMLHDHEEISEQVLRLAPKVDSICVHGDTPGCVGIAELVRKTLTDAGYEVGF